MLIFTVLLIEPLCFTLPSPPGWSTLPQAQKHGAKGPWTETSGKSKSPLQNCFSPLFFTVTRHRPHPYNVPLQHKKRRKTTDECNNLYESQRLHGEKMVTWCMSQLRWQHGKVPKVESRSVAVKTHKTIGNDWNILHLDNSSGHVTYVINAWQSRVGRPTLPTCKFTALYNSTQRHKALQMLKGVNSTVCNRNTIKSYGVGFALGKYAQCKG